MTVTAVERLGVDAAIIFADILLIIEPMGIELEFAKGDGPKIHNPIRQPETSNACARWKMWPHWNMCLRLFVALAKRWPEIFR